MGVVLLFKMYICAFYFMLTQIFALIQKDFRLEFKKPATIASMLLYMVASIMVCYQSIQTIQDPIIWSALLWILLIFGATNIVHQSFDKETNKQQYYYYLLASPHQIVVAKIIYNTVVIVGLNLISYAVFSILLGNKIENQWEFILILILGSTGLAATLSFVSAIASKAGNNAGMVAILGFPVLIPLVITLVKSSKNVVDGIAFSANSKYIITLAGLDFAVILLAIILFPFIWKD